MEKNMFKAKKDSKSADWVFGYLTKSFGTYIIESEGKDEKESFDVREDTICQSVGLSEIVSIDYNGVVTYGKSIFEGDIVEIVKIDHKRIVFIKDIRMLYETGILDIDIISSKIIGNSHDDDYYCENCNIKVEAKDLCWIPVSTPFGISALILCRDCANKRMVKKND